MTTRSENQAAGRPRAASRKAKLLALVFSIVLSLVVVEIVLRLTWHNSYRGDSTDLIVRLGVHHANRNYVIDRAVLYPDDPRVRLRTNDRSYILPADQFEDPDCTIAFLGGSTTECSAVREELRFPGLVSELLAEKGFHVNILNAGTAGSTVMESVNLLFNHIVLDEPDIVVMMHATNDNGILVQHGGYQTRMSRPLLGKDVFAWCKQMVSRHWFAAAAARKVLSRTGMRDIDALEMSHRNSVAWTNRIPLKDFQDRLTVFVHMAQDLGMKPVLMTQPLSTATNALTPDWANLGAQDRFNQAIRVVGVGERVPVIDLVRHLANNHPERKKPMEIFYDGMHVTDKGSQVYAKYIAESLLPLVRTTAARRGRFSRTKGSAG